MARDKKRFGICLQNPGCEDLEGEDYLYPAECFVFVELPRKAKRVLSAPRRRAATRPT